MNVPVYLKVHQHWEAMAQEHITSKMRRSSILEAGWLWNWCFLGLQNILANQTCQAGQTYERMDVSFVKYLLPVLKNNCISEISKAPLWVLVRILNAPHVAWSSRLHAHFRRSCLRKPSCAWTYALQWLVGGIHVGNCWKNTEGLLNLQQPGLLRSFVCMD